MSRFQMPTRMSREEFIGAADAQPVSPGQKRVSLSLPRDEKRAAATYTVTLRLNEYQMQLIRQEVERKAGTMSASALMKSILISELERRAESNHGS